MISYEIYKTIHLITLVAYVSLLGILFGKEFSASSSSRWRTWGYGLTLVILFVSGMGLIARLGFKHGEPFPLWIKIKIGLWFLQALFLFLYFRFSHKHRKSYYMLLMSLIIMAILTVVSKIT